ncbi:L,D-transpeptidase family protein [Listeria seeligeri]|uniref:toxin Cry1Ac domain D-VI-related protein n=1 Tax=Listeria seeligeri TaxID=1640 RepID=UPI0016294C43|nr:toxin Cry1Ac domain D-VI-related protein [Listeria seeligeri]EIY6893198.1 L,D-transpeptidase family protein [Listeria monocytogenes]MBC1581578.1 L,D-transpeptidase family protein [Listeria seeligeri]MBC1750462.1 L,D-transpeptidase family protein [Listeria seeligeri]MBC1880816.1 L,D-transpeptidase family protein [Listeria seeligeri]MBC6122852.1 L,D-transpeptidase family protein [Listeria seeligeri]
MKGKRTIWIVVCSFLVLTIFVSVSLVKHQEAVKAEEKQEQKEKVVKDKEEALVSNTTSSIENLFTDEKQNKLSDTYKIEDVENIEKQIKQIKSNSIQKKLTAELEKAKKLFSQVQSAQKQVLGLFKDNTKKELATNVTNDSINKAEKAQQATPQEIAKKNLQKDIALARKLLTQKEQEAKKEQTKKAAKKTEENKVSSGTNEASSNGQTKENNASSNKANSNGSSQKDGSSASSSSSNNQTNSSGNVSGSGKQTAGSNSSNKGNSSAINQPIVAKMSLAQRSNQIITVVASGSSAQVKLWEKSNGTWKQSLSTYGHVGSQGVGTGSEYASRTPRGAYGLSFAFGTHNPGTKLGFKQITKNSYWISNVKDSQYNTWQERSSSSSKDEHLADYPTQYEYAMALNYNHGVGGGSAIFLHVDNGRATAGCISVPRSTMLQLMKTIRSGAYIVNVNSEQELLNY